jgi:hypothetical protein
MQRLFFYTLFASCLSSLVSGFTAGKGMKLGNRVLYRHGNIENTLQDVFQEELHNTSNPLAQDVITQVYFGNWLRDHSQLLDEVSIRLVGRRTMVKLMQTLAWNEFGSHEVIKVTWDNLGVKSLPEHLDNPVDQPNVTEIDLQLPNLEPAENLVVDKETGMKKYLRHGFTYILNQTLESKPFYDSGNFYEAFRRLGNALHPIEDFYAHSNFVELTLLELGYRHVFPWVGPDTKVNLMGKWVYPLVTGCGGKVAFKYNVFSILKDKALQFACTPDKKSSTSRCSWWWSKVVDAWTYVKEGWYTPSLVAALDKVIAILNFSLKRWSLQDRCVFEKANCTDPTHTQLAKDHLDHPINEIAGHCASLAARRFSIAVRAYWTGKRPISEVQKVIEEIIVHPQLSKRGSFTAKVKDHIRRWAGQKENAVRLSLLTRERALAADNHMGLVEDWLN